MAATLTSRAGAVTPRGSRTTVRVGALVAVTVVVTGACLLAGSLVPLLAGQIAALALAWPKARVAVGLCYSLLATVLGIAVLLIVPIRFGLELPVWLAAMTLWLVLTVATWQLAGRDRTTLAATFRVHTWGALAGPLLLVATVGYSSWRWGPVPAWAMSGDSRNHLLTSEFISSSGGWTFFDYPALGNAITAFVHLPADGAAGSQLMHGVQVMSQTLVLFLVVLGVLAGLAARGGGTDGLAQLRAAVGSSLVISPFFLSQVLWDGFHPVPLAVALLLSTAIPLLLGDPPVWVAVVVTGGATLLLAVCYPLVAPLPGAMLLAWLIARQPRFDRRAALWAGASLAAAGAFAVILSLLGRSSGLTAQLTAAGGLWRHSPLLLVAVLVVAAATWLLQRSWRAARALALVVVPSLFLAVTVGWLVSLNHEWSYYGAKTLWIGVAAMLPIALARVASPGAPERGSLLTGLVPLGLFVVLAFVPLLYDATGATVPLKHVASGWLLPSADQARLIPALADGEPHSYVWGVNDPESDRRIDIWMSAFNFPGGTRDLSSRRASWGYGDDVTAPTTFCRLMSEQPEVVVWTDTEQEAGQLRSACDVPARRVAVIP